jgi:dienelactone hydrolase
VPTLISRDEAVNRISNRELIHRSAYELGRHLIGYEIQKIMAVVDWFERQGASEEDSTINTGIIGWGEGGLLALYAAALDPRIAASCVSGYFQSRQEVWNEPLERSAFGLSEVDHRSFPGP